MRSPRAVQFHPDGGQFDVVSLLARTPPWGCIVRVMSRTESRKIPNREILPSSLPPFFRDQVTAHPPLPPGLEVALGNASALVGVNLRTAAREQARLDITNPLLSKVRRIVLCYPTRSCHKGVRNTGNCAPCFTLPYTPLPNEGAQHGKVRPVGVCYPTPPWQKGYATQMARG